MKKSLKQLFLIITLFISFFALSLNASAEDNNFNTAPGELKIPFEKKWQDVDENDRPTSIKISLYKYIDDTFNINNAILVESKDVTASDNWQYEFDISSETLIDNNGNHYKFKIVETVSGGFEEIESSHLDPEVTFRPPSADDNAVDFYESCSNLTISFNKFTLPTEGKVPFLAAQFTNSYKDKKYCGPNGNQECLYAVWTSEPISQGERVIIVDFIQSKKKGFSNATINNTYFISGDGTLGGLSVGKNNQNIEQAMFDASSNWAKVMVGAYTKSDASALEASITNTIKK